MTKKVYVYTESIIGRGRRMRTIKSYMEDADNRPAGFDYMRMVLATLVLITHGLHTTLASRERYGRTLS